MLIISQDRDAAFSYNSEENTLFTIPCISEGVLLGINLYSDDNFLGTFDSIKEAVIEMMSIQSTTSDHYIVKSDFEFNEDWEDI